MLDGISFSASSLDKLTPMTSWLGPEIVYWACVPQKERGRPCLGHFGLLPVLLLTVDWLMDGRRTDGRIDRLVDWLIDLFIYLLMDWLTDSLTDWLFYWFIDIECLLGREWEYVILSCVRSLAASDVLKRPSQGWLRYHLGIVSDRNQINVAITRAKKGLIILGDCWLPLKLRPYGAIQIRLLPLLLLRLFTFADVLAFRQEETVD